MNTNLTLAKTLTHVIKNWHQQPEMSKEWMSTLPPDPQTCMKYQSYIGWGNFLQGILYTGWGNFQENDHEKQLEKGQRNTIKSQWTATLIKHLLIMGKTLWGERCRIVKAENNESHKARQRRAAFELCNTYRFNLLNFHPDHHCIFRKQKHFFQTSPIDSILQWQRQANIALNFKFLKQNNTLYTFLGLPIEPPPTTQEIKNSKKQKRKPPIYPPTLKPNIKFTTTPNNKRTHKNITPSSTSHIPISSTNHDTSTQLGVDRTQV